MPDPRIEIAARELFEWHYLTREDASLDWVTMYWRECANAPHKGDCDRAELKGPITCDRCVCDEFRQEARSVLKALDAAQPEVEVYAARLIDEMLAAQSRFAAAWRDDTELSPSQLRDEQIRDEARRKLLNMAARPEVEGDAVVEAAMDPEADAVWRMIYDACTGGNGATGFRIFQHALTTARAPAAPDTWQPIETAPRDGSEFLVYDGWQICIASYINEKYLAVRAPKQDNRRITEFHSWMPLPKPPIAAAKDAKP